MCNFRLNSFIFASLSRFRFCIVSIFEVPWRTQIIKLHLNDSKYFGLIIGTWLKCNHYELISFIVHLPRTYPHAQHAQLRHLLEGSKQIDRLSKWNFFSRFSLDSRAFSKTGGKTLSSLKVKKKSCYPIYVSVLLISFLAIPRTSFYLLVMFDFERFLKTLKNGSRIFKKKRWPRMLDNAIVKNFVTKICQHWFIGTLPNLTIMGVVWTH